MDLPTIFDDFLYGCVIVVDDVLKVLQQVNFLQVVDEVMEAHTPCCGTCPGNCLV